MSPASAASTGDSSADANRPAALVVTTEGRAASVLEGLVQLVFGFRYGLHAHVVGSYGEARQWLSAAPRNLRCVILIQKAAPGPDAGIAAFGLRGHPLFALVPKAHAPRYVQWTEKLTNAHVVAWETAFRDSGRALARRLGEELEKAGQTRPLAGIDAVPVTRRRSFVDERLAGVDTLPALPEATTPILELLADPDVDVDRLEQVLLLDPAIARRLFAVAGSAAFAGSESTVGNLRDAVARLGLREVAAVVMQTRLAGDFLRAAESRVDYQRFWAHSVACALTCHQIVQQNLLPLQVELQFHDYWAAGLLHDVGKLVLGVHFWEHFSLVMGDVVTSGRTFREVERQFGDLVGHDEIGFLVLTRSHVSPLVCDAVATHHDLPDRPNALLCLLHVADTVVKHLGLSFPLEAGGDCDARVLAALDCDAQIVDEICETLGDTVLAQVKEMLRDMA
jgi:HD-like signal output (HDOD) protein